MTRILLIDDDPEIALLVGFVLERTGRFEVSVVGDAGDALAAARMGGHDAILLDLVMPGLEPARLIGELRADTRVGSTPVILFSASADAEWSQDLLDIGAAGMIAKPFDAATLAARIDRILAQEC